MGARLARWAAAVLLIAVCLVTFVAPLPASAQEATTTTEAPTTTTTTVASPSPPTFDQVHEIEQELLVGMSLVVLLVAAHVVGSWRR